MHDIGADRSLLLDGVLQRLLGRHQICGRQTNLDRRNDHIHFVDGMGGGFTAVSKVCVIGPPTRPNADIDYTFAQIPVKELRVEYAANCGNMSAAMGPWRSARRPVKMPPMPRQTIISV